MLRLISAIILGLLLVSGCSHGDNPTTPEANFDSINYLKVGISERFPDGSPASGVGVLGLFNLSIDPSKAAADLVSIRNTALTDVLEVVDITNFLQMAPCYDCAKIKSVALDSDGNLVVSIGIKHPFDIGEPAKPITGRNRADLHVFNIEGTVLSNLDCSVFDALEERVANFKLVNADGYSGYLDATVSDIFRTEATIHPYITHFDDYSQGNFDPSNPMGFESVINPPPTGNLIMPMGSDYDYQDYVFDLSNDPIDFIYVVGCTYAVSAASKADRFTPEYRLPQHNKKAASEVSVEIITNELASGDPSSTAEIEIHVVDINHGVEIGDALDQMLADSSVRNIRIDIPGVESGSISVDVSSPTGTGHDPSDPLVFPATITNSANGDEGTYLGLVKVVDNYLSGLNESPLLNGMEGIKRVNPLESPLTGLFNIYEFATYNTFEISIEHQSGEPFAILAPDQFQIEMGNTVVWDAASSFDPDGSIVMYEWDFNIENGDPANFSADETTIPPVGTIESLPYNDLGTFYAAVRVTDNLVLTDIAVVSFEVVEFIPHYWTQFMSNKHHNGQTSATGPQTNNIEWKYYSSGTTPLSVIEGYDGTIYFGSKSYEGQPGPQRLDAVNPDGSQKWVYWPTEPADWCSPLGVTPDDTVLYVDRKGGYYGMVSKIVGVDTSDGYELWTYDFMTQDNQGLALDNGDFVISGQRYGCYRTLRLDKDGNEIWIKPTEGYGSDSPVQGPSGMIYIKSGFNILAIDPDTGDTLHSYYYYQPGTFMRTSPAVRSDGSIILCMSIYFSKTSNILICCLDSTLNEQWTLEDTEGSPYAGVGIGLNDEIYFTATSTGPNKLYAVAPDGSQVDWCLTGASYWTSPAVGAGGTIYIGTTNGAAAINPDGSLLWYFTTTGCGSAPIIAHDGSMYVNIEHGVLHKIADL
ncbi:PQQ-binding-like beta-propeller repeat protein [bacterium]|nr:PQQ-binding-like beta-propeller repeat protein [bacterium]